MTGEELYCVKYLQEHGINSSNFDDAVKLLDRYNVGDYNIIKVPNEDFFLELAKKLNELWPAGSKEGKYRWRDNTKDLSNRLKLLWKDRKLKDYTIDQCLMAARSYLADFENDTKFMKIVKYFVSKQKEDAYMCKDGSIKRFYYTQSDLADALENELEMNALENEWNELVSQASLGEGTLI